MHVVVTGAAGNLGTKLCALLERVDWCGSITALDIVAAKAGPKARSVIADVSDPEDRRWRDPVADADAVVHFASANPWPDSSWAECTKSFDMTTQLLSTAGTKKPCRFIFASSNHAMGGYKDNPIPGDGKIRMSTPALSGTRFFVPGHGYTYGAAYGATKILGERATLARARESAGRVTGIAIRIGWCQGGANRPETINSTGKPGEPVGQPEAEMKRDFRWFRNMWLSNGDFERLFAAALTSGTASWPGPGIIIPGVSNNRSTAWALDEAERWIGYYPEDDLWAELKLDPDA